MTQQEPPKSKMEFAPELPHTTTSFFGFGNMNHGPTPNMGQSFGGSAN
jgi:hypothetical protein